MHIYVDILSEILRKSKYFDSSTTFLKLTAMIITKSAHTSPVLSARQSPDLDGNDSFS